MLQEELSLDLPDLSATQELGRRLGALLFPGAVIALIGPLGAGKTFFVRAVAEGLGVPDSRGVTSPTFVLIQEYHGRLPIFHFDAYRLHDDAEFAELGAEEYFAGQGVCLIEWADRVARMLPAEHVQITFTVTGESTRQVKIIGFGERYTRLAANLVY
jgi:tRNA threonylcarbamoyladenosine biosynthesis protein TsaE